MHGRSIVNTAIGESHFVVAVLPMVDKDLLVIWNPLTPVNPRFRVCDCVVFENFNLELLASQSFDGDQHFC